MKVALISHSYPSQAKPHAGKFIYDQACLADSDPDIDLSVWVPTPHSLPFTGRRKRNTSPLNDPKATRLAYLSFPSKRFPAFIARSLSRSLSKKLKEHNIDLAHVHWLYPGGLAIPMLKKMGKAVILTIHGSDWMQTKEDPLLRALFRESLHQADNILYSGPGLRSDVEAAFPDISEKGIVIYNVVDEEMYKPATADQKSVLMKQLGWDPGVRHVLTVANIREEKGIDLLLDAITEHTLPKGLHFHIVGATDHSTYSNKITHRLARSNNHPITLHPPVPPSDLISYYQAADLYLLPSRREGFNVSILEAMACGLPALSTDTGGAREIISEETGMMIDELNAEAIHHGIRHMIQQLSAFDPELIRRPIIQRFGKDPYLHRLKAIYRSFKDQ